MRFVVEDDCLVISGDGLPEAQRLQQLRAQIDLSGFRAEPLTFDNELRIPLFKKDDGK